MRRIFISGPMKGYENYNKAAFFAAADRLSSWGVVLNPAILPVGMEDADYIHICKAMIDVSTDVVMLPGWRQSRGATTEWRHARMRMKTIWEDADAETCE